MARLSRTQRQSGFMPAPDVGGYTHPSLDPLVGVRSPTAVTAPALALQNQRTITTVMVARSDRTTMTRRFPRQARDGTLATDTSPQKKPFATYAKVVGPQPPSLILPLPLQSQQTVAVRMVALRDRTTMTRRFPRQGFDGSLTRDSSPQHTPFPMFQRNLGPQPPGVILPLPTRAQVTLIVAFETAVLATRRRSQRLFSPTLKSAAATTTLTDVVSGSAAPSGSVVESWSVLSLSQMKVGTLLVAVQTMRARIAKRYVSRLTRGPAITVTVDAVTGSASPTGSVVESWSVLSLSQMKVGVRLVAVQVARARLAKRFVSKLTRGPAITITTDVVSGSAAASGSVVEQKLYTETVSGSAAASGSVVEGVSVLALSQMTIRVKLAVQATARVLRAKRYQTRLRRGAVATVTSDSVSGSAGATGSVVESKTGTDAVSGSASASGSTSQTGTGDDTLTGAAQTSGSLAETLIGTDSPSGAADASGALSEALSGIDAVSGSAGPSGSVVETSFKGYSDTPTGSATPTASIVESAIFSQAVVGGPAPAGTISEGYSTPSLGSGGTTSTPWTYSPAFVEKAKPARLFLDSPYGVATPIGYVQERWIVFPQLEPPTLDLADDEDELLALGFFDPR